MKNALILHGTSNNSRGNWFQWLKDELEKMGYKVWVPDLPDSDRPSRQRYLEALEQNKHWIFDEDSIIVGHSSGAVTALHVLENLSAGMKVKACYLVGVFHTDLGWENLKELDADKVNFVVVKDRAKKFVIIHSDNDPHVPLAEPEFVAKQLGVDVTVIPGQGHFSLSTHEGYDKFPKLLEMIGKVDEEMPSPVGLIDKLAYIYLKDKKVLVTLSKGKDKWYIPGGKRELGESDEEALTREVKEELNVDLRPETITYYKTFEAPAHGKPAGTIVRMTCYMSEFVGQITASNEIEKTDFFSYDQKDLTAPVDHLIFNDLHEKGLL